jgi:hypothetical protein
VGQDTVYTKVWIRFRERVIELKFQPSWEGVVTGIGVTLAAAVLAPVVKEVARPLVAAGAHGAALLMEQVRSGVSYVKEEVEDLVAEAQFERLKRSIDRELEG